MASLVPRYQLPGLAPDEAVYGKGAKFLVPEASVLARHLAAKAEAVRRLVPLQQADLETGGMHKLYYELEQPLAIVLAGMEKQGIKVNAGTLEDLGAELAQGISRYESDIYMHAGMEFNINSPKQLGEVLFDKLDLPVIKKTKTGYSTDAEVLEKLEPYHEIVKLILHYRQLTKLQSTYVEGLLKEIRRDTGKIHTYYRQTIAATGRLSSQFPNLQNIPIRLEEGRRFVKRSCPPSLAGRFWLPITRRSSFACLRIFRAMRD